MNQQQPPWPPRRDPPRSQSPAKVRAITVVAVVATLFVNAERLRNRTYHMQVHALRNVNEHMDQVEAAKKFAQFLAVQGVPIRIEFP